MPLTNVGQHRPLESFNQPDVSDEVSALRIEELFGVTKTRSRWIAVVLPLGLSFAGRTAQHRCELRCPRDGHDKIQKREDHNEKTGLLGAVYVNAVSGSGTGKPCFRRRVEARSQLAGHWILHEGFTSTRYILTCDGYRWIPVGISISFQRLARCRGKLRVRSEYSAELHQWRAVQHSG